MKKSLILTFVFAIISFTGAFAQKINSTAQPKPSKQEQKAEKSTPADAKTPSADPSKGRRVEKANNGKHKGHAKGHKKGKNGVKHGKAKNGEVHEPKREGESGKGRTKGKPRNPGNAPVDSPKKDKTEN